MIKKHLKSGILVITIAFALIASAFIVQSNVAREEKQVFAETNSNYSNWDSASVYVGGDKVLYNNNVYKAKWWTQGEAPDTSDVWEDTLEAVPNTNENTDTTVPV